MRASELVGRAVRMGRLPLVAAGLALVAAGPATAKPVRVSSPDGRLVIALDLDPAGVPSWSLARAGRPVVLPSRIALDLDPGGPVTGLARESERRAERDETWRTVVGKSSEVRDRFRQATVALREKSGGKRRIEIDLRAYDDGVAFRYRLPEQAGLADFVLQREASEFRFASASTAWAARYVSFTTSQEKEFDRIALADLTPKDIVGLPFTLQAPGGPALAITESDLRDWAGMYLTGLEGAPTALVTTLSPLPGGGGAVVRSRPPRSSPWRVVMVADAPAGLVGSNLVLNLAEPSKLADTSWIRSGKSVFPWWPSFKVERQPFAGAMNTDTNLHYLDFAAEMGFHYLEFEPPWYGPEAESIKHPERFDVTKPLFDLDMPKILAHAKAKGVRLFVWVHWKGLLARLEEALDVYAGWGAAGIKVDFMDRDDQEMVVLYERIARESAARRLLVTFHGGYKPTGLRRTWPNVIAHEGVMGAEYNKWSARVTPEHNVTLPFTRMLAGPMDYTPGGFRNAAQGQFFADFDEPMVQGTRAHEIAKYVVFESPMPMVADHPAALRGQPGLDFVVAVPTTWDETRGLAGEVGDFAVTGRRSGRDWYVGAMTDWTAREVEVPLAFLGPGRWRATLWADGPEAATRATDLARSESVVTAADTLHLRLAPGGGAAVRLVPEAR